jgi:hypothetical protein
MLLQLAGGAPCSTMLTKGMLLCLSGMQLHKLGYPLVQA